MAHATLQGNPVETVGELPQAGASAPDFNLVKSDLSEVSLSGCRGKRIILNIFPSIDTDTCAASVRKFNERAGAADNTSVVCVSADLPFAQGRFCGAEDIKNVETGSTFRSSFGNDYGVEFITGPLAGLLSRAVVVVNESGKVIHSQQVAEIVDEPDYEAALAVL